MANYKIRTGIGGSGPSQNQTSTFFRGRQIGDRVRDTINLRTAIRAVGFAPAFSYFEIAKVGGNESERCFYYFIGVDVSVSVGLNLGSTSNWSDFSSDVALDDFGGLVSFFTIGRAAGEGYNQVCRMSFDTGSAAGLSIDTSGWTFGLQIGANVTASIGALMLDTSDQEMLFFFFAEGYVRRLFTNEAITTPERLTGMYATLFDRGKLTADADRTIYNGNIEMLRRHIIQRYYSLNPDTQAARIDQLVRNTISRRDYQATLQNRIRDWAKRHPGRLHLVRDGEYTY